MPDNKSVMVGQSRPRQPFPVVPKDLDSASPYYNLEDAGDDRMTGLSARVIAITPRDDFRYGYRFWIDKNTRMLLKSDLTGVDGKPIEQVMFTRLVIGPTVRRIFAPLPAAARRGSRAGERASCPAASG